MKRREPSREGRRGRLVWRAAGALLLSGAALAFLAWQLRRAGWAGIAARLRAADAGWLLLAAGLTAGRFGLFAARLSWVTRRVVPACRAAGFLPIVLASQFLVLILPGFRPGATLFRAHLAGRRYGGRFGEHLAANLVDQAAQAVAWVATAALLLPVLLVHGAGSGSRKLAIGIAAAGLAVALGAGLLHRYRRRLRAWATTPVPERGGRLRRASGATLRGAGRLASDRVALAVGVFGGLGYVLLGGAAQFAALQAVGEPASWPLALLAVALGTTAGTASNTPGGLGVTEATQVAFLSAQGMTPGGAASGVLLARGLHLAAVAAGGALSLGLIARRTSLRTALGACERAGDAD